MRRVLATAAALAIMSAIAPGTSQAAVAEACSLSAATVGMTPVPDILTDALDLHLEDVEAGVFGLAPGGPGTTTCVGTGGLLRTPVVGGAGSYALDFCLVGKLWGTLTLGPDTLGFRIDVLNGHAVMDVTSLNGAPAVGGGPVSVQPVPATGCVTGGATGITIVGPIVYAG